MNNKVASIGFEGRDKLVRGANYIADAVKTTYGPGGQNFAIEKGNRITNDGITIARELLGTQEDEIEDRGARILVEAVTKANDEAGDGSTGATILTQAILKESLKYLPAKDRLVGKLTGAELIKKLEIEKLQVIDKLVSLATPVTTVEQLIEVAQVSVEDEELGKLIGTTQFELGPGGVILAEEVNDKECSVQRVQGIMLDNGFGTQMVINNPEKEALELKDVQVIYTNHTVTKLEPLVPVIQSLVQMGHRQIVIMARAFTNEAIQECMKQLDSGLGLYPLNAPYTDQAEIMADLEVVLGGRFVNAESTSLEDVLVSDVGFATHVLAKRMSTIFAGKSNDEKIKNRVEVLQKKFDGSPSQFEKKALTQRMAQLQDGFAILKIGANSETERKYRKDKADDAVNAVKAAFQEGVVKGGGLAFYEIAQELPEDYILRNALMAPHLQLKHNAGVDFVVPGWVVDSVKINRVGLEKACSVAGVLATAAGAVTTKFKKDNCCGNKE